MEGMSIFVGSILLIAFITIPGLALTLAIFPRWRQISFIERSGIAVIVGLIPQLLIYFLNKNAGVEINFTTSLALVIFVTAAGALVYHTRIKSQSSTHPKHAH